MWESYIFMKHKHSLHLKLKQLRNKCKLTQADVADTLNVTHQTVSNWENGKTQPDETVIRDLCKLYQVTPNELYGYEDDSPVSEDTLHTVSKQQKTFEALAISVVLVIMCQFPYIGVIISILIGIWLLKSKRKYYFVYILCILCFLNSCRATMISLEYLLDLGTSTIEKM